MELEIDFVSDVACPWCAIGLAGLDEALRRTAGQVTAQIRFQPFELNPGMRPEGENIDEYIGGRYGAGPGRMAAMREAVRERAAGVGFTFNQDGERRRARSSPAAASARRFARPSGTGRRRAFAACLPSSSTANG